jgi:hypothetical protein
MACASATDRRAKPSRRTDDRRGAFDIGFVVAGKPVADGETMLVERAGLEAAWPAEWEIADKESINLIELAEQPFIVPPQRYGS